MKATKLSIDTKTLIRFWLIPLCFVLIAALLHKATTALIILGSAVFIALAISPLVKKISNVLPGKNRNLSITLAYILVVVCLLALVAIITPTIINESIRFAGGLPQLLDATNENSFITGLGEQLGIGDIHAQIRQNLGKAATDIAANLGAFITTSAAGIATAASTVFLTLVLSLFILLEGPGILAQFWGTFHDNKDAKRAARVTDRVAKTISKYVSNVLTVGLINAVCTAVTVFILALCFNFSPGLALPFGLITGTFSLIPMFGSFIGGCVVSLLLAFNAGLAGLIFFFYTLVYLQIEANIISPKIQGKALRLPALVILGSVTIGVCMFGLLGAIIAIPITACIKVLIEEYGNEISFINDKKPTAKPADANADSAKTKTDTATAIVTPTDRD